MQQADGYKTHADLFELEEVRELREELALQLGGNRSAAETLISSHPEFMRHQVSFGCFSVRMCAEWLLGQR